MANISVDCPHCHTKNSYFDVRHFTNTQIANNRATPYRATHHAFAECGGCGNAITAWFEVHGKGDHTDWRPDGQVGRLTGYRSHGAADTRIKLLAYTPKPDSASCPENCPPPVERAFIDAERARLDRNFTLAAGGYRKTVDRAVTPFVDEKVKTKMLGNKLANLEAKGWLPEAMIDWIKLVKDDGNFAMHDDDRDFDTAKEIEPTREFTVALLNYLYTMPKMVEDAKTAAKPDST